MTGLLSPLRLRLVAIGVAAATLLSGSAYAGAQGADGQLTERRAAELHDLLTPSADEPWRTIPWMTSVLQAQRVALEEGKPIFIWAMDGHPLGCV